jgi:hypothetical protein
MMKAVALNTGQMLPQPIKQLYISSNFVKQRSQA